MTTSRQELYAQLIASYHILHHHQAFNEAGTISIRNPSNPNTFITSTRPAICVSSQADFSEWNVSNGMPINSTPHDNPRRLPSTARAQIYLHSSIYTMYPGVHSVVHCTSIESIVFGLCDANGSMTRAVFNEAGFVDEYNPILDISHHRDKLLPTHPNNLLIDHPELGDALARSLTSHTNGTPILPEHGVVFVRGNGVVIWSESLEDVVHKAVNLQRNTKIQTSAMAQRTDTEIEIQYLSLDEQNDCAKAGVDRAPDAWDAWATEVSRLPVYRNQLAHLLQY